MTKRRQSQRLPPGKQNHSASPSPGQAPEATWLLHPRGKTETAGPANVHSIPPHTWPDGLWDSIDDNRTTRSDFAARSHPPGQGHVRLPQRGWWPLTVPQQSESAPQMTVGGKPLRMHPQTGLEGVEALITALHAGWSPAIFLHLIRGARCRQNIRQAWHSPFDLIKPR